MHVRFVTLSSNTDVIVGMMDLIAKGEKAWPDLYEKLGVEPLEVVYEDFSTPDGYELTVRRVLQHLDLDDTIEVKGRISRQTASTTSMWIDSSINSVIVALKRQLRCIHFPATGHSR